MISDEVLIEELADHHHEIWANWTEHLLAHLTPDTITRWRRQIRTPYADLSEEEKESDRKIARKTLAVLREAMKNEGNEGNDGTKELAGR